MRCLLPALGLVIEVVVPGADHGDGARRHPGQVLEDDRDLGIQGDGGADVEEVAGDDHQVVLVGLVQHPVELAQVVVQIRDEEGVHVGILPAARHNTLTGRSRDPVPSGRGAC